MSLYTSTGALSCNLFILLFSVLLWYIHTRGQYPNCDSMNAFIIILNFTVFINFEIVANACNLRYFT